MVVRLGEKITHTEDRLKMGDDGCCYKQLLTCHGGQSVDLCYTVDLFLSTIDMRVCINVIWVKVRALRVRGLSVFSVCAS